MTKIIIGTDDIHGTCFGILDSDILVTLFEKDRDQYFDNLGDDLSLFINEYESYTGNEDYYVPTYGGALVVKGIFYPLYDNDKIRSDPYLISLLEKIGIENVDVAFGRKHLKIVEIPDDVEWYCAYPDVGPMYVQEKSRIWS